MSTVPFFARPSRVALALALGVGALLCACSGGSSSDAAMMAPPAGTAQSAQEPPYIQGQPHPLMVKEGEGAMFAVTGVTGGTPQTLSYQWQRNGVDIPGANRDYLLLPTATLADDGALYTVVVRNEAGRVASKPGLLAVVSADTELPWR